jgi:hypothetical protein
MGQAEIQEAARPSTKSDTLDRPDFSTGASTVRKLADGRTAWLHDGSCMSRETHVQFCESLRVRVPGATHRNIYVRSRQAGQRVMTSVTRFLTRRLKLKVNEAKSAVARPVERKFLGFSFSRNKEPKRRIAPKALLRCKQKIRELTRRTRGISLEHWPCDVRCTGGVTLIWAFVRNLRTWLAMLREKAQVGAPRGRKYRSANQGRTAP